MIINTINSVFLELTTRCNLWCLKCPNRFAFGAGSDIPEDTLRYILFTALKSFTGQIILATGEPCLCVDYLQLLHQWTEKKEGRKVTVFTNGSLLINVPKEILKSPKFTFVVSLDGISASTATLQKGLNIKSLLRNIIELRKHKTIRNLSLNFTVHKLMLKDIEKIFHFAMKVGLKEIYFTPLLNFNFPNKDIIKKLQLNNTEFRVLKKQLKILSQEHGINYSLGTNRHCKSRRPIFRVDGKVSICEGTDGIYELELSNSILERIYSFKIPKEICKICIKKDTNKGYIRKLPVRISKNINQAKKRTSKEYPI